MDQHLVNKLKESVDIGRNIGYRTALQDIMDILNARVKRVVKEATSEKKYEVLAAIDEIMFLTEQIEELNK